MATRNKGGALTEEEKMIVKALLNMGRRNQDIQALVNIGRKSTINSARITDVKKDEKQKIATDVVLLSWERKKKLTNLTTGLNPYDDERLISSREAMILAVQCFNSAAIRFKTQVFTILYNIAWTYLLHEYYIKKGEEIFDAQGKTISLSKMLVRSDCPLKPLFIKNIKAIQNLRDKSEHSLLGKGDAVWSPIFQACCLNYENAICSLFGQSLSLTSELSFALQFASLSFEQAIELNTPELPNHIKAIDAQIHDGMSEQHLQNIEFKFQVIYTLSSASKSVARFKFIQSPASEGKKIHNVLEKPVPADNMYPYKPKAVCCLVKEKTKKEFNTHKHTLLWKKYCIRLQNGSNNPGKTNKKFCIFHKARGDYTYSDAWIEFICNHLNS